MSRSALRPVLARVAAAVLLFTVAGVAGHWVSGRLGRDALRNELEFHLSRIFQGTAHIESASLRFTPRPVLELRNARVDYPAPGIGALQAKAASGGIDPLALLTGRFRLEWLTIDGLHLRAERRVGERWSPHFLDRPRNPDSPGEEPELERDRLETWMGPLRWVEGLSRLLLARPWASRHLRLVDASLSIRDGSPSARTGGSDSTADRIFELEIVDIEIALEHDWLRGRPRLQAQGQVRAPSGRLATLELRGSRSRAGELDLEIATTDLPLEAFQPYLRGLDTKAELGGTLTGVFDYHSPERAHGRLDLDLLVTESRGHLRIGEGRLSLDSPRFALGGAFEAVPGALRVEGLRVRGPRLGMSFDAKLPRPLAEDATAGIRIATYDIGTSAARRVAATLPSEDRATLERLLARVRGGRLRHLSLRGAAAIREWRQLASGELSELPAGFALTSRVEDLTLALSDRGDAGESNEAGESDADPTLLRDFSADIEWQGRRISLTGARMSFGGEPLPELDITVHGARELLEAGADAARVSPGALPLPGLPELWSRLSGDGDGPSPPLRIEVDELHHPALRWPVEDARALVTPAAGGGLRISLQRAHWAGRPIRAESTVEVSETNRSERISTEVWVGDALAFRGPEAPEAANTESDHEATALAAETTSSALYDSGLAESGEAEPARLVWARGRVHVGRLRDAFAVEHLDCELVLAGDRLRVPALEAHFETGGSLRARGAIELGAQDELPTHLAFELEDADLPTILAGFGLSSDLATGTLDARGGLEARAPSGQPLGVGLRGVVELEAREGRLKGGVPLVSTLAHATEGLNPLDARDHLHYESLRGIMEVDDGRLSSQEMTIDGPVRVFASGSIDVGADPKEVDALVGVFVLRHADLLLGDVPLVRWLVPGSDRGLLGAYFRVDGSLEAPQVTAQAARSLAEGMPLPDVVRAPLEAIGELGRRIGTGGDGPSSPRDARRNRLRRNGGPASPSTAPEAPSS